MEFKEAYCVVEGEYSDYRVLGVFLDKPTAQAWVDAMNKATDENEWGRSTSVETMTLVATETKPVMIKTYEKYAELNDTGTVEERELNIREEWAIDCSYGLPPKRPSVRYVRAPYHRNKGGRLEIIGSTEKSVLKVYSEKLAMWKAGQFGGPLVPEVTE